MTGTKAGGLKTAKTNKLIHGEDYYQRIGRTGGSKSGIKKGFALMDPERIKACGHKGGSISRRGKALDKKN